MFKVTEAGILVFPRQGTTVYARRQPADRLLKVAAGRYSLCRSGASIAGSISSSVSSRNC